MFVAHISIRFKDKKEIQIKRCSLQQKQEEKQRRKMKVKVA